MLLPYGFASRLWIPFFNSIRQWDSLRSDTPAVVAFRMALSWFVSSIIFTSETRSFVLYIYILNKSCWNAQVFVVLFSSTTYLALNLYCGKSRLKSCHSKQVRCFLQGPLFTRVTCLFWQRTRSNWHRFG